MSDEITLTIPRVRPAHRVAHLVLGGVATRLELTLEALEDLELAIDAVLGRLEPDHAEPVTVNLRLVDDSLETVIGPLSPRVLAELERDPDGALGLRRVLDQTVDAVQIDGDRVLLAKRVQDVG